MMRKNNGFGSRAVLLIAALIALWFSGALWAQETQERAAIVVNAKSILEMGEMRAQIEDLGIHIGHIIPPRIFIAHLNPQRKAMLLDLPGVEQVITTPEEATRTKGLGPEASLGLEAFSRWISAEDKGQASPAFEPEQLEGDMLRIAPEGVTPLDPGSRLGPPDNYRTSEFMQGTAVVTLILPESNGAAETSEEDWTMGEIGEIMAQTIMGLDYYVTLNEHADITWIYHLTSAPAAGGLWGTVDCDYEAIKHNMLQPDVYNSYFASLGYPQSGWSAKCYALINDMRALYNAEWGYVVQCADNSSGVTIKYLDHIAAAYVTGPFTGMSYLNASNGIENFHAVIRHETMHIFGAMDEYVANGTDPHYYWGFLGVANANSQKEDGTGYRNGRGEGRPCIANSLAYRDLFCPYSWGQLGWLDDDIDGIPNTVDLYPQSVVTTCGVTGANATVTGTAQESVLQPEQDGWGHHYQALSINKIDQVQYRVQGRTWLSADAVDAGFDSWQEDYTLTTPNLPTGLWEIEVRARNDCGNSEIVHAKAVAMVMSGVSNAAPYARFNATPPQGSATTVFRFDATPSGDIEDATDKLQVRWDFNGDGVFDTSYSADKVAWHAFGANGIYPAVLQVKDSKGATASYTQNIYVYSINIPPVAVFSANRFDLYGERYPSFYFDASGSYDAETPAQDLLFRWDWENDGTWDTDYSAATVRSHCFGDLDEGVTAHSGRWTVYMEVKDGNGHTDTTTLTVWANAYNHAPTALFTATQTTGTPGQTFYFNASGSTDPDTGEVWEFPIEYRWDYDGDGVFETDYSAGYMTRQTSFAAEGVYNVTLEVRDRYHALSQYTLAVAVSDDGLNTAPVAAFTIVESSTPVKPGYNVYMVPGGKGGEAKAKTQHTFNFNATACHDAEDAASALVVRWDWENDGTWDTPFSTKKLAIHTYQDTEYPTARLEVRDTEGLWDIITVKVEQEVAPYPPVGLTAETGSTRVELAWFESSDLDLDGYRVYRRLISEPDFGAALADTGLDTEYVDSGAENGETYVYAITAYDSEGLESYYSDELTVTLDKPLPPVDLMRAVGNNIVYLRWDEYTDPDFTGYRVYRRETGETDWTLLTVWALNIASYTDSTAINGTCYDYAVSVMNAAGESDLSDPVQAQPRPSDTTPPPAPNNLMGAYGGGTVVMLFWEYAHADDVNMYLIYRRESSSGDYAIVGFNFFNVNTFMDDDLVPGFTYYYAVKAVDTSGNLSNYSNEIYFTIPSDD
ncbi:MAG: PKD domain-containing protein [Planctomycetota bacterium]